MTYFFMPVGQPFDGCESPLSGYYMCSNSSLLLDSVHGPQAFSNIALSQFYTQFTGFGRTLFRFPSEVHLEVVQLYYYMAATTESTPSVIITFYSIASESYHPRRPLPSDAVQIDFFVITGGQQFTSVCLDLDTNLTNLVMIPSLNDAELYISEVNFFSASVSNEVCDGIYATEPPPPTTEQTTVPTTSELETTVPTTFELETTVPTTPEVEKTTVSTTSELETTVPTTPEVGRTTVRTTGTGNVTDLFAVK